MNGLGLAAMVFALLASIFLWSHVVAAAPLRRARAIERFSGDVLAYAIASGAAAPMLINPRRVETLGADITTACDDGADRAISRTTIYKFWRDRAVSRGDTLRAAHELARRQARGIRLRDHIRQRHLVPEGARTPLTLLTSPPGAVA